MKWFVRFGMFLLVLLVQASVSNAQNFKLPFPAGETWWVTQGNNQGGHATDMLRYSWDFNTADDLGRPVLAVGNGEVVFAGPSGDWGNTVVIKHGDNLYSRVAHLKDLVVAKGQLVQQGYILGTCGNTGRSAGSHIHYQVQGSMTGNSIPSSFTDAGVPTGCDCETDDGSHRYTSQNTPSGPGFFANGWDPTKSPQFLRAYKDAGGYSAIGSPWDNPSHAGNDALVHCWPDNCSDPSALSVQDFLTPTGIWSQLVYNSQKGQVFLVTGDILKKWSLGYGYSTYGPPVSNQELKNASLIQEFTKQKLTWDQPTVSYASVSGPDPIALETLPPVLSTAAPAPPCQNINSVNSSNDDGYFTGLVMNGALFIHYPSLELF